MSPFITVRRRTREATERLGLSKLYRRTGTREQAQ
jgi:hypothetical protein